MQTSHFVLVIAALQINDLISCILAVTIWFNGVLSLHLIGNRKSERNKGKVRGEPIINRRSKRLWGGLDFSERVLGQGCNLRVKIEVIGNYNFLLPIMSFIHANTASFIFHPYNVFFCFPSLQCSNISFSSLSLLSVTKMPTRQMELHLASPR